MRSGMSVNVAEYEELVASSAIQKKTKETDSLNVVLDVHNLSHLKDTKVPVTDDSPKYGRDSTNGKILVLFSKGQFVNQIASDDENTPFGIILDRTPFYAEQGGQTYDTGVIEIEEKAKFEVQNVQVYGGYVLHVGFLKFGALKVSEEVLCSYDEIRRAPVRRNHTATHLLNFALREIVGKEVDQKGSLVNPNRFRFDFSCKKPIANEQIDQIERIVQSFIDRDEEVFFRNTQLHVAKQIAGLRAVFGEVYPDPVRVLSVGYSVEDLMADPSSEKWANTSIEFCGGTHVARTSDIRSFVVTNELGTAKGIRRIVAVTGNDARRAVEEADRFAKKIDEIRTLLGKELNLAVIQLVKELDAAGEDSTLPLLRKEVFRKDLADLKKKFDDEDKAFKAAKQEEALKKFKEAVDPNVPYVVEILDIGSNSKIAIAAANVIDKAACMILSADEETQKVLYIARVPKHLIDQGFSAKDWCGQLAQVLGGKSGGSDASSQGSGTNMTSLQEAKQIATEYAKSKVK